MANVTLTADIIAAEALMVLDNNLGMASRVYRGHESEYAKRINGYKFGETISIRRPTDFTVRDGRVAQTQDVKEGKVTLTVDQQKGVDFEFTSADLSLEIDEFSERILKPAMVQLANKVDVDLLALYKDVNNWVGTPGQTINSFDDFSKAPERLDENAVPADMRSGMLAPADGWAMVGNQTSLFQPQNQAYRQGTLGDVGGVETYRSQNVQTHTNGAFGGTVAIDGSIVTTTISFDDVKDTWQQTIHIDGLTGATAALKQGDVFTIADVYAVNPVTKEKLDFLQMFTLKADATAASNETDLVISPPILWTGAKQTVSIDAAITDLNNQGVTFIGTASTAYKQNLVFHRHAFALAMVPMDSPEGAIKVIRKSHKGLALRMIPYYDGVNDVGQWRLDILYGLKTVDERLATRVSGSA